MKLEPDLQAGMGALVEQAHVTVALNDEQVADLTLIIFKSSKTEEKYMLLGLPGHVDGKQLTTAGIIAEDLPSVEAAREAGKEWLINKGYLGKVENVLEYDRGANN